ncbi:hypothetical protein [Cryobacterium luteum]|uniref:hypothetical protein n=1 Tax=Cryobacterium luteum TaxID=1424661 RepID=UPI001428C207|nr:hypothetical protein [Cryobacterium luteum]
MLNDNDNDNASSNNRLPEIFIIGGLVTFVIFGAFLVLGIPQGGSAVPPLMMGIGLINSIGGVVVWVVRRRHTRP